jgi:hypothetical protein
LNFRRGSINLEIIKTPAVPKFAPNGANFPVSLYLSPVGKSQKIKLSKNIFQDFHPQIFPIFPGSVKW